MKSIVYIGPYRQYDYVGSLSNMLLSNIKTYLDNKRIKTYSRPLYLDNGLVEQNSLLNNSIIQNCEYIDDDIKNCQAIIQHAPIEYLAIQKKWKNIAIPILDAKLHTASKYNQIQKLNEFDKIIVLNDNDRNVLLRSGISKPIEVYEYNIYNSLSSDILEKKYDLGLDNEAYKIGFLGAYAENISIIQKIILSFIIAFRSTSNHKLFLFLRGTQKDKNEIETYYNNILKNLNIIYYDNISFIFNSLNLENSIISLNTIDCLLSVNDDVSLYVYENYMKKQNHSIINKCSVETIKVPIILIDHKYDNEDILWSISTIDFINKMKQVKTNSIINKNKNTFDNSIGECIWRTLQ